MASGLGLTNGGGATTLAKATTTLFHKVISALQANDIGAAIPRPLA